MKPYPLSTKQLGLDTDWRTHSWEELYEHFRRVIMTLMDYSPFSNQPIAYPHGCIDVIKYIPRHTQHVLVVISGTHGVEGPAGSFVQAQILRDPFFVEQQHTAIVLIHGLNSWGYQNGRRVNESNIDLNRNGNIPEAGTTDDGYAPYHHLVMPKAWNSDALAELDTAIHLPGVIPAMLKGQYSHPDGICYGGTTQSASMRILSEICTKTLSRFARVGILDIHTGIGPFGAMTPFSIVHTPNEVAEFKRWFPTLELPDLTPSESTVPTVSGDLLSAMRDWLPNSRVYPFGVEIGTVPMLPSVPHFIAENWMHHHPNMLSDAETKDIQHHFWEMWYPTDNRTAWLDGAWEQTRSAAMTIMTGM